MTVCDKRGHDFKNVIAGSYAITRQCSRCGELEDIRTSKIEIVYLNGKMTVDLSHFFPAGIRELKKLLKAVALDGRRIKENIDTIRIYLMAELAITQKEYEQCKLKKNAEQIEYVRKQLALLDKFENERSNYEQL